MPRPERCLLATCQGRLAPTSQLEALAARRQAHAPGEGVDTGESVYYYYRAQLDSAN